MKKSLALPILAIVLIMGCASEGKMAVAADSSPPAQERPLADAEPAEADLKAPAAPETRAADTTAEPAVEFDTGKEEIAGSRADGATPGSAAPRPRSAAAPTVSGLKAGFADDNRQFNYFVGFLDEFRDVPHRVIPIDERIIVRVTDRDGKSVPNAHVSIRGTGSELANGLTHADGTFLFFPGEHGNTASRYEALVTAWQREYRLTMDREGPRTITLDLDARRPEYLRVPLDIVFVLDTTGSMGEEIERLKATIEIINLNLVSLSSQPQVRFGMVLYKDRGDEYVTQIVPLTGNLDEFQTALAKVVADGGGDTPEDLEAALSDTMQSMDWNRAGIRLAFIITDAPPHLDEYQPRYTYADAARDARTQGVKIFSVGTGGLDISGEYILRQIAQYTYGKYIFLTYGEKGESEGGAEGSVSHHTGANFQSDKLEAIVIRFAKEELAHLTDQPLDEGEEYFEAIKTTSEGDQETLSKLFDMALGQLVDYSSIRIPKGTTASSLPIIPTPDSLALDAEYFTDALGQALTMSDLFRMVERKDIQTLLGELELQLSGLVQEENAARLGKLLGAEMLVSGTLYRKPESFELFLKLIRVESGEVLAVTKARIDPKLGLGDHSLD